MEASMKKLLLLTLLAFGQFAFATVDSNTNVFIPVKHIQTGEYFVQIAPVIGCYGLPRGPQLQQLMKPYMVNNVGCGQTSQVDINALSCAQLVSSVEADDFSTFKKITIDVSKCEDNDGQEFIQAVKKVVKLNFATKTVPKPILIIKGSNPKLLWY